MNQLFLRSLLAALPLLGLSLKLRDAFLFGGLAAGILILTVFLFLVFHFVIPESLRRLSFLLLLLFFVVLGERLFHLPFVFVGSLCLLTPPDLLRIEKNWLKISTKTLLAGTLFWALLLAQGFFSDWAGSRIGFQFFQTPAGSYFLIGLGLALVPGGTRLAPRRGLGRGRGRKRGKR